MRIPHSTAIIHRSMMAYPICSSEQSLVRKRIRGSKKVDDSPPGYFQRHSSRFFRCGRGHLRQTRNIRRGKNRVASCRKLRHEAARFFMPYGVRRRMPGERKTTAHAGVDRSSAPSERARRDAPLQNIPKTGRKRHDFAEADASLSYEENTAAPGRKRRRNGADGSALFRPAPATARKKEGQRSTGHGRDNFFLRGRECGRACGRGRIRRSAFRP